MAAVVGCGSASISWVQSKDYSSKRNVRNRFRVSCVSSSAVSDPYKALRIHPGASESEYHPDVCRGSNCGVQFHQINEAYNVVMSNLRGELSNPEMQMYEQYDMAGDDEQIRGVNDQDWDL
ncbi:Hypothetical predicted protein [Olea europaea subsp. europaea]|uniref:J domain-containing protein n=1 Tax=Olea europaea subsp. europaea TaxID=158383 RepID=A0A8S0R726_OLEEU|nr:Hypothetical predicted protein [Olea europaea subsp. europaea]